MDQIHPRHVADVDPAVLYGNDPRRAWPERPWVVANMVESVDGATAVAGRSSGLGGDDDLTVFRALRGVADVILVGAGTVRAEDYGPVRLPEAIVDRRLAQGRPPVPRLAVVSGRLDLDPDARIFSGYPIVITGEGSDEARRAALETVAEIIVTPGSKVDLGFALGLLRARGVEVVLTEGGPSIIGQLVAADLLDELCVTVASVVAGGDSSRLVAGVGPFDPPVEMRLARVLVGDGDLFCRYLTVR